MGSICESNPKIEPKKEVKENKIGIISKIEFLNEKYGIYRVYEISDNRLAVELEKCLKIYSLSNFDLIIEINQEKINKSIELKNKDIAMTNYDTVNIYKLSENNYICYQKILPDLGEIFEIYELKNENLILSVVHHIDIYSKSNEEYQKISEIELKDSGTNIVEIKDNIVFIFEQSKFYTYSDDLSRCALEILNIEKKQFLYYSYGSLNVLNHDSLAYYGCDAIVKKNKYLLLNYFDDFNILDIEKNENIKRIYYLNYFQHNFKNIANFDDDNFILLPCKDIYKYDEISNKIIFVKKLDIEMENIIDVIKLKNNYLVAYNKNEILILKY